MTLAQLTAEAESVISATKKKLPPEVRAVAGEVPVVCEGWPSDEVLGEEFEADILGLFVGASRGEEGSVDNVVPTQIFLFLENIYDYAEGDLSVFRAEVRLTYLHELGHYLGWDEADLEARGLE
jgi:predicted Zn-dependent protease with MMP-like domain